MAQNAWRRNPRRNKAQAGLMYRPQGSSLSKGVICLTSRSFESLGDGAGSITSNMPLLTAETQTPSRRDGHAFLSSVRMEASLSTLTISSAARATPAALCIFTAFALRRLCMA